ncbi:MAG: flagellar basal body P-ring formation chaperone FlgA [Bdellovibrionota bacterium]
MMKSFCLLFFSISCLASGEIQLVFPSAVEVSPRTEISMYDIVEAKNLNEEMISELKEITVKENKSNTLHKSELAKMLRTVKARFVLPAEMKILRSQSSISRMEVERKIKNKIYSLCAGCEVQVQISSVPNKMESDWTLDLNIDLSKNTVMVPVFATKNTDVKGWIVAEIKRYQNVPVLSKSVKIGEILTEEMFAIEKRQLINSNDVIKKIELISGLQAARFLNAGQVILFADVKKEQVLKKGQMVKAMVGGIDFEVAISAEAQESGSVGDVVKIKNLDSQKVFGAKIMDRGTVRIE